MYKRQEYEWLKEVDKFALTNAIYNMDAAYQKFFREHAGYPKFKRKHDNHKSYITNFTNDNIAVDFEENRVKLPKLKGIKVKLHRNFSGQIKSATVSQVPSGKYYVSVLVETEHMELPHIKQNTGIDLGIKELCITSAGKKYENPKIIKMCIRDRFRSSRMPELGKWHSVNMRENAAQEIVGNFRKIFRNRCV